MVSWKVHIETIEKEWLMKNLFKLAFRICYINHFSDISVNFFFVPFQDWTTEELRTTVATITFSPGDPTTPVWEMPTGIGSTPETIAENVVWIWSASNLPMNTNGLNKECQVRLSPNYWAKRLSQNKSFLVAGLKAEDASKLTQKFRQLKCFRLLS